jgi:hypothetical protein
MHTFMAINHTMVVEQIGILTRRSRVTREARALTTNQSNAHNFIKQHIALHYFKVFEYSESQ